LDPGETVAAQRLSQILSPDELPTYEKSGIAAIYLALKSDVDNDCGKLTIKFRLTPVAVDSMPEIT
jgi:hypothetical protein